MYFETNVNGVFIYFSVNLTCRVRCKIAVFHLLVLCYYNTPHKIPLSVLCVPIEFMCVVFNYSVNAQFQS